MFELTNDILIRALVFVLAYFITYLAVNKLFRGNNAVSLIISIVVALFAMLYLDYSRMLMLFDVYGIMAALVLIFLPAVILFYFFYSSSIDGAIRKMFLIFYGILSVFLVLRTDRFDGETSSAIIIIVVIAVGLLAVLDRWIKNKISAHLSLRRRRS